MKYKYKIIDYSNLCSGSLVLNPIEHKEIFEIMDWRNNQIKFLRQDKLLTKEDQVEYFKKIIKMQCKSDYPSQILFSFKESNEFIAYGGLTHIDWKEGLAEISYLSRLDSEVSETLYCYRLNTFIDILSFLAFESLNLSKIYTVTYPDRTHQIKCLDLLMKRDLISIYRRDNEKHEDPIFHYLQYNNVR